MKRRYRKNLGLIRVSDSVLSGRTATLLIVTAFIVQSGGYILLEGMDLINAAYMVVITFSTVGYGEIVELSREGRIFTMICIMINIAIFAYVVAVFSYHIIQGRLFKKLHAMSITRSIKSIENHVIVCGYGRYGLEIIDQFLSQEVPFVVIEKSEKIIEKIQESEVFIPYVHGNATDDQALKDAGIERASCLITALPEDSENLFVVLSARQLNPNLNLISRAHDKTAERKLKLAGASHAIMPDQIGGFYMATLVSKPETVEFFSFLTKEFESDVGFEELKEADLPKICRGMTIAELNIRHASGANIIGFKTEKGKYVINPGPDTILTKNSSFILIGNKEQLSRLRQHLSSFGN